ncbi:glycosyltransferase family 2 protein [Enorma phocaeensis]|uniref:glycosyltransferase family 2 protein n=1 Tax=Enorma phocaeensis TaxID=1871019 RepID=UPI0023528613|nr:glycosyltransferase family 2 protein [Enorma phocaeensis]
MNQDLPCLVIVIPCYNEEAVLPLTAPLFAAKLDELVAAYGLSEKSRILFVDDGSSDGTWNCIEELVDGSSSFFGLRLSRNRGHQNALLAGLMEARGICDLSISVDCDGQDDLDAMNEMVEAYRSGVDVVYGVRSNRDSDTFFKRNSAQLFYRFMTAMGVESVYNHADYRLMSKRALDGLAEFQEVNLFLRGMVPLVGFTSTSVYYERHERVAGSSHYPLKKMIALAVNGITSLSIEPIRWIAYLGFMVSAFSFIGVVWAIVMALLGQSVAGWASMTVVICFIGGVQLLSIGVIGEYIGKVYLETKARPRYIVSERVVHGESDGGHERNQVAR